VYVEKPFAVDAVQAERLIESAERHGRKVTVGNDVQFTHAAMHFRTLVEEGFLGGEPVHMESFYCYEFSTSYAAALLGDRKHWVRHLPGKLLQNIISHGIVRVAEYLQDKDPLVIAHGCTSPLLRHFGEDEILDELRVMIATKSGPTAYFTFSSQMRPSLHQFRLYGPANGLVLDDDEHSVIKLHGKRYKSYAQKFIPSIKGAAQQLANLKRNIKLFAKQDFHMKAGLKNLIEAFYRSIREDGPLPIPYRQILLTCKIMDEIFAQTNGKDEQQHNRSRSSNGDRQEIIADQIVTHEKREVVNVDVGR
jgi:predicted dehydrogenase